LGFPGFIKGYAPDKESFFLPGFQWQALLIIANFGFALGIPDRTKKNRPRQEAGFGQKNDDYYL
jgi:hypothetical protein